MKYLVFHSCGGCCGPYQDPWVGDEDKFRETYFSETDTLHHFWTEGMPYDKMMEDLELFAPHPIYLSNKMGCCHLCVVKVPDDLVDSWKEPDQFRDQQIRDAMQWYKGKIGLDGVTMTAEEEDQAYQEAMAECEGYQLVDYLPPTSSRID